MIKWQLGAIAVGGALVKSFEFAKGRIVLKGAYRRGVCEFLLGDDRCQTTGSDTHELCVCKEDKQRDTLEELTDSAEVGESETWTIDALK